MRRWKKFDLLNAQSAGHAFYLVIKPGEATLGLTETIMDPTVRTEFRFDYIDNLDGEDSYKFNFSLNQLVLSLRSQSDITV